MVGGNRRWVLLKFDIRERVELLRKVDYEVSVECLENVMSRI